MSYNSRVPYSKVGLEMLAQAMNVTTAALYVDPSTSSMRLRDSFSVGTARVSGRPGDHGSAGLASLPMCELEEESE